MKNRLFFIFSVLPLALTGCVKTINTGGNGNIGGGDRHTVTEAEWNNIFIPNNFVFNSEYTFFVDNTQSFFTVNHGKVRAGAKNFIDGNIEHEFKYREFEDLHEYDGYYTEFYHEVQFLELVSTLDFLYYIFSNNAWSLDQRYGNFKDPIVRFEDATYDEKSKIYLFDMPNRHGGTVTQGICFLNGKPLIILEKITSGDTSFYNRRVSSFLQGDRYDKTTNKIRNEVTLEEWNKAFDVVDFVMNSKVLMVFSNELLIMLVDHGTITFLNNSSYSSCFTESSYSFKNMTIKDNQGVDVTSYFTEIEYEYEGETYKRYISIMEFLYMFRLFNINMVDYTYNEERYSYDPIGSEQSFLNDSVCFVDGVLFITLDMNLYFI